MTSKLEKQEHNREQLDERAAQHIDSLTVEQLEAMVARKRGEEQAKSAPRTLAGMMETTLRSMGGVQRGGCEVQHAKEAAKSGSEAPATSSATRAVGVQLCDNHISGRGKRTAHVIITSQDEVKGPHV